MMFILLLLIFLLNHENDRVLEKKKIDRYFPVDSDELLSGMLYDLWFDLKLGDSRYDDDWRLILEDL